MSSSHLAAMQARSLRARLTPTADPIVVAQEARRIFTNAADDVRTRWMNLELGGYSEARNEIGPLHQVLRVPVHDRLAVHVAAYRTQRGHRLGRQELVHFFVEPLSKLVDAREQLVAEKKPTIEITFGKHPTSSEYPTTASFPRDVFERIIGGFIAALHLQLGEIK
ncbi:MAG: hypothetical protein ACHREM_01535 [Polyangiales bacterium]